MNIETFFSKYATNRKSLMNGMKNYKNKNSKAHASYINICSHFDFYDWPMSNIGYLMFLYKNKLPLSHEPGACRYCKTNSRLFLSYEEGYSDWCSATCSRKDASRIPIEKQQITMNKMHTKVKELLTDNTSGYREKLSNASAAYMNQPHIKEKQSTQMKEAIASGKFTPNITNTWTRWESAVDNKKFRSSFEGIFYLYYTKIRGVVPEYENIRIPYTINGVSKTYIVDFNINTTLFEIKPKSLKYAELNMAKESAALAWCDINNYKFEFIHEDEIFQMAKILKKEYGESIAFLNEFYKKYAKFL